MSTRSETDSSVESGPSTDASVVTETGSGECACAGAATEMRDVTGTCGSYQETRVCDGCSWGAWTGQSSPCNCSPGRVGETRQVEGGEGCDKGVRNEREVCNDAGTRYEWVPQGEFDGSLKECQPGLTESRGMSGACGAYTQTRECNDACEPGEWSTDTSCSCTYGDGSNTRACATDLGDNCGLQTCQVEGTWGQCEDNPNAPAECEPCTPVCTTVFGDEVCEGERGAQSCGNNSYKLCICQANGSWTNCGTVCFQ